MASMQLLISMLVGVCVAGMAWTGRGAYGGVIDYVERDLALRLKTLRSSTARLRMRINVWVTIVVAVSLALTFGLQSPVFGVLAAIGLSAGPWLVVRRAANTRRERIEDQLADAMVTFSSAIRAGMSLAQALEMLASECPKPIREEFGQIIGEYKMGKPLERTLEEAKERLRSENFVLFSAALLASRESGGKLNETVERISKSILELQRLERKVRSETAQARKSAVYMAMVPPVIVVVYGFIDPESVNLLLGTFPGHLLLAVALILNVLAYFWAVKILNADI
jgi:tight adherence protein B